VVLQGLARVPEQRHASMDALIEALERATRRRAPRVAVALAAAVIPVGVWIASARMPEVDPCTRGAAIIADSWGPTQREQVGVIGAGYTPAFIDHAALRLRGALDEYAARWARHHDELCAEHSIAESPTGAAQSECLEDRRASFTSLTEVLRRQPIDIASLDALLADLPLLSTCRSAGLRGWTVVPEEQALRAPVAALRAELRQIGIRRAVDSDSPASLAELGDLLGRAEAVGDPHLIASVELEFGLAEIARGHAQRASEFFDAALVRALTNGHERLAVEVIIAWLRLAERAPSVVVDAERLAMIAGALIAHSGGDDGLTAALANKRGELRFNRGDWRGATEDFERSAAAWERAVGPDQPQAARPRLSEASARLRLRDRAGAERILDALMPKINATLGEGHDIVLHALSLRASIADQSGDWRHAIEVYQKALAQAEAAGGDRRPHISTLTYNIAGIAALHGEVELARTNLARSRATWPMTGDPLTEGEFLQLEANLSFAAGDHDAGMRQADTAIRLFSTGDGARDHRLAGARVLRATGLVGLRQYDEALATLSADDWIIEREAHGRGRMGVIAATALGDILAAGRWLAYAELVPPGTHDHALAMLRLLMVRAPTTEQRAAGQRHRDEFAAGTYPLDPLLLAFDEWLGGRWPPPPGSPFAGVSAGAPRASTHGDSARKPGVHSVP
jgi:tetratricopeptide (TPR) repeat protein